MTAKREVTKPKTTTPHDVLKAMDWHTRHTDPFTYGDLSSVAVKAGGTERDADKYLQRRRKRGEIAFTRVGKLTLWRVATP